MLVFSFCRKAHLQACEVLAFAIVAERKGLFTLSSVKWVLHSSTVWVGGRDIKLCDRSFGCDVIHDSAVERESVLCVHLWVLFIFHILVASCGVGDWWSDVDFSSVLGYVKAIFT